MPFTREAQQRLRDNFISTLYVSAEEEKKYKKYVGENLSGVLDQSALTLGSRGTILYEAARAVVEEIFTDSTLRKKSKKEKPSSNKRSDT